MCIKQTHSGVSHYFLFLRKSVITKIENESIVVTAWGSVLNDSSEIAAISRISLTSPLFTGDTRLQ